MSMTTELAAVKTSISALRASLNSLPTLTTAEREWLLRLDAQRVREARAAYAASLIAPVLADGEWEF